MWGECFFSSWCTIQLHSSFFAFGQSIIRSEHAADQSVLCSELVNTKKEHTDSFYPFLVQCQPDAALTVSGRVLVIAMMELKAHKNTDQEDMAKCVRMTSLSALCVAEYATNLEYIQSVSHL